MEAIGQAKGFAGTLTPKGVVDTFLAAMAARDFQCVRACLADSGFSSRSPIATFANADAFVADVSRVGPILEDVRPRKTFIDGEDVCVIVDYVTRMDRRQVSPVVHLMHVEKGKITSLETFFDATAYVAMFEVD